MKKFIKVISLILALMMLLSAFASCGDTVGDGEDTTQEYSQDSTSDQTSNDGVTDTHNGNGGSTASDDGRESSTPEIGNTSASESSDTDAPESSDTGAPESSDTGAPESSDTDDPESSDTDDPESSDTNAPESSDTGASESSDTDAPEETTEHISALPGLIQGNDAENIENANQLANKVQTGYVDVDLTDYLISNNNMMLHYNTAIGAPQLVTSLTDKNGNAYISGTMDVFIKMLDESASEGYKTYYASNSVVGASTNIYRLGYYYYENRFEDQVFADLSEGNYKNIRLNYNSNDSKQVTILEREETRIKFRIDNRSDPSVVFTIPKFSTEEYKYLQITMKAGAGVGANGELFIKAGGNGSFTDSQRIEFFVSSDGQYHTYTIPMSGVSNYTGNVTGIRVDINGAPGSEFEITSIKAVSLGENAPDALFLNRSFHTYSDKLHHVIQVAASEETANIHSIGMVTKIDASTVESFVIKDRGGLHYDTLNKIAWNRVAYVGFLIKDVGVFGYMLPYDGKGGSIRVTLDEENGVYVIEQSKVPDGNHILPSADGTGNKNDFFMGQRIYTDTEKNLARFIYEAECETNPLGATNFIINPLKSGGAKFDGYDSLRGCYRFTVDAANGFKGPFADYPNRHFGVEFEVKGDDRDRQIYVMTYAPIGALESAAILNDQKMMLPIPMEVSKNFKGDGENTIFMKDDAQYGETFVPLIVRSNSSDKFTILNLYQNWGRFALKQISSIQYFSPYYHLSYGTTETNCLVPYGSGGLGLPDFRGMSAPLWSTTNPQHNSSGSHSFVRYTDTNGVFIANQISEVFIDSYGPTYADMTTVFTSDDGKLKITYNHMEQPHHDENRSYFTLKIEVLEDLDIANFKDDFYFYSVKPNDPTGVYQRVGYLNADNGSAVVAANKSDTPVDYVLGTIAPYFSFYDMDNYTAKFNNNDDCTGPGYANVAMIIGDSEFIVGGEKVTPNFVLKDMTGTLRLTLDMGETNLKSGDSLTIDGILLPWGSQAMEGTYDEIEDQNVRNVRQDSIINPLKATAVENCKVERRSVGKFLPEVVSTDGKSATFTLSGGASNNAVRIYGFDMLTVPVIEKLNENGEWEIYEVSSINKRDRLGYGYMYDGYNVFYDGDGTYSYSFVVDMENGEQTFRITADKEFEGWGEEKDPTEDLPLNVYIEPDNMADLGATLGDAYGCTYDTVVDEATGEKFFRFFGTGGSVEGYLIPYEKSPLYPTTGKYFVFKYRVPTTNKVKINYFDFFASTTVKSYMTSGSVRTSGVVKKDGLWHTLIVDLSAIKTYTPNEKGEYIAEFLRFDVLNSGSKIPETDYIDIAYYGFSDNLDDVCVLNSDMSFVDFYEDSTFKQINTATKEIIVPIDPTNLYFDPSEVVNLSTGGGLGTIMSPDGQFVRYSGVGAGEGFIYVYENPNGTKVTGKYLAVKYRAPKGNSVPANFQVYASTTASGANDNSHFNDQRFTYSGDWEVMIIDLSRCSTFTAADDGSYSAKHIRFDVINGRCTDTEESPAYIDVAYIAVHDKLNELLDLNKDAKYITIIDNNGNTKKVNPDGTDYVPEGGEEEPDTPVVPDPPVEEGRFNVDVLAPDFQKPSGSTMTLESDGSYARFTANGAGEAYIYAYKNTTQEVTGKYFVVKYRIPTGVNFPTNFQIYSSTQNTAAEQNGGKDQFLVGSILSSDSWQLLIVDLTRIDTFTQTDGKYIANYVRFDHINGQYTHSEEAPSYIDIEYFALHDSITEILAENADISQVVYVDKSGNQNKITNDGSFKEPVEEKDRDEGDPLKVYATPDEMEDLKVRGLGKQLSDDGEYFTYSGTGASEGSVWAYKNSAGDKVTGQYFVLKYRVPADSAALPTNIEIFASTQNADETAGDSFRVQNFLSDGEWHVIVVDLSIGATFNAANGEYSAKYIRLDIIDGKRDSTAYVDVEYFGIHDNLDEIYALNSDMGSVYFVNEVVTESGLQVGKGQTVTLGEQQ